MHPIVVISVIGLWLIYGVIIKLTKKRKHDWSLLVAFVFLLVFGYFFFTDDYESFEYDLFAYITAGLFALWLVIDNSVLLFKKNVSEFDFHDLEQKLEHVSSASELLRRRFISTIELLNDGISFRDGDYIFGSDRFIELIGLDDNEFTVESFEKLIVKEDLVQYHMTLEKLSKKYPTYSIKYRIQNNDRITWFIERGKMILIDKKRTFISILRPMDVKLYPETDVDVLNSLPSRKELLAEMQRLHRKKNAYHLVLIQLTNVPSINEKYGRDFGDLMMGEYLSKMRFKFIKDNKSLFRISGIKFAMLIKEKTKFDLFERALVGAGELFTMQMKFGGVTQTVYPNLGISESPYEGKNADIVYREAHDALTLTLNDQYDKSFCFYNKK